jgi:hypothetical protein
MSTRTKKQTTKKPAAKQSKKPTAKPATKKSAATKRSGVGPRWSIGLFRRDDGGLSTVYVSKDGGPMPYEAKRVGGRKILFHSVYSGVKYSEARQQLLNDAAKGGVKADASS